MNIKVFESKQVMGQHAAAAGADLIREALRVRGFANIVVATGASQFEMLEALVQEPDVDWHRVTGFHLDEYIGVPVTHPASFRRYLWQRFVSRLEVPLQSFYFLNGEEDPIQECERVSAILNRHSIDVAFVGIGENGHLAFNDPPADFETESPYLVVALDEACRRQQWGEGWFPRLDDVPRQAISMSVQQILKSRHIICTVPDERKSQAVRLAVRGPVTPHVPASILQQHFDTTLFLDRPAAREL